jgi:hypothetical protein
MILALCFLAPILDVVTGRSPGFLDALGPPTPRSLRDSPQLLVVAHQSHNPLRS